MRRLILTIVRLLLAPLAALPAAVSGNSMAANPAPFAVRNKPKQKVQQKREKPKTDPVRDALDKLFASAAAYKEHDPKRLVFGERYNGFNTPTAGSTRSLLHD